MLSEIGDEIDEWNGVEISDHSAKMIDDVLGAVLL